VTIRATLQDGRIVEAWTAEAVEARLEEAADTLRRLRMSGVWPAQHRSSWPDVVQDFWEAYGGGDFLEYHDEPMRPPPPSSSAIDRMDEAMTWFAYLDDPLDRRVVWAKAFGAGDRRVAAMIGQSRWTVRRRYKRAINMIVEALNAYAR